MQLQNWQSNLFTLMLFHAKATQDFPHQIKPAIYNEAFSGFLY